MFRAEYTITFRNFLDSMKAFRKVSRGSAFIFAFDHWIVPGLGILAAAVPVSSYLLHQHDLWQQWYWLCFVGLGFVVLPPLVYRRQMQQAFRQRISLAEGGIIILEFDQQQLRFTIPNKTEVKYEWTAFTNYAETELVLTLLVGEAAFHTVPKSALTEQARSELKRLLATNAKEL